MREYEEYLLNAILIYVIAMMLIIGIVVLSGAEVCGPDACDAAVNFVEWLRTPILVF